MLIQYIYVVYTSLGHLASLEVPFLQSVHQFEHIMYALKYRVTDISGSL